ncbi:PREDICTED: TMV resistance protein N-like [Fragaria vesca subsp. vesca]
MQLKVFCNKTCRHTHSHSSHCREPQLYVPAISVVFVENTIVSNVGPAVSSYHVIVSPFEGAYVKVELRILKFTKANQKLSYKVTFTTKTRQPEPEFGGLVWKDGVHRVRSPIVVAWGTASRKIGIGFPGSHLPAKLACEANTEKLKDDDSPRLGLVECDLCSSKIEPEDQSTFLIEMAASSSSSSSLDRCKYDVFLSFRGEDTRKSFVCHLHKALEQKAIHTFIDSENLEKGNRISELLNAVAESSVSVVVLSQNYAASTWCLKELVKIMDCMDEKKQIVVPVFYEVDPSDIRKSKKMFGEALTKHEENPKFNKEEVERWRTALRRITDLSGWDSRQYKFIRSVNSVGCCLVLDDIELIEEIVGDMLEKWIHIPRPSSLANKLVGMDHHIKEVFFYNVKERFAKKKDEAQMRGELFSMILKGDVQSVDIFNEGSNLILERLGKKKVLVVLDDVETSSQIEALLGDFSSFGVGSRILITTRDKESLAGVNETYEPTCLNSNESFELFKKHAFRTNQPREECSDLSKRAIEYAQGLPLALKSLGSFSL